MIKTNYIYYIQQWLYGDTLIVTALKAIKAEKAARATKHKAVAPNRSSGNT